MRTCVKVSEPMLDGIPKPAKLDGRECPYDMIANGMWTGWLGTVGKDPTESWLGAGCGRVV